jgi:hypothetical protein
MNSTARDLFNGPFIDAINMQPLFIKRWEEQTLNSEKYKSYCKTFEKGGILLLKYDSEFPDCDNPKLCFVEDNMENPVWVKLMKSISNFYELYVSYDPAIHYMICMIIHASDNDKLYNQLLRLNY